MSYGNLNGLNSIGALGAGSKAPSFTPSQLSGLVLWFDANKNVYSDAGTTLATNGQTVQQWNDQSVSVNNLTQSFGGARPTYSTGALNGLPVITFNGTSSTLQTASMTLNQPEHVFIVFKDITWGTSASPFDGFNFISMLLQNTGSSPGLGMYFSGDGPANSDLTINTFGVMDLLFSAASSFSRVNNGTKRTTPSSSGTDAAGGLTVGARASSGAPANCSFAEILVYNTALSDGNAALVSRYLGSKWGITVS